MAIAGLPVRVVDLVSVAERGSLGFAAEVGGLVLRSICLRHSVRKKFDLDLSDRLLAVVRLASSSNQLSRPDRRQSLGVASDARSILSSLLKPEYCSLSIRRAGCISFAYSNHVSLEQSGTFPRVAYLT